MFRYIEVHTNSIHLIYIGVYPHKYIGHEDNVQSGGVVRVRYMLFNVHLCNHITQFCDQLHCRSNRSINYTERTEVRLFVSLNKGRVEGH